ncbi:MAG: hypothetical protein ACLUHA_16115 [Bacteroides stercoris]
MSRKNTYFTFLPQYVFYGYLVSGCRRWYGVLGLASQSTSLLQVKRLFHLLVSNLSVNLHRIAPSCRLSMLPSSNGMRTGVKRHELQMSL